MNDLLKSITVTNDTFIISIAVVSASRGSTRCRRICKRSCIDAGAAIQAKTQAWEVDFSKKLVDRLDRRWAATCIRCRPTTSPR